MDEDVVEHELRDRPVEDPPRIGDDDLRGRQLIEEQRVDSGRGRMDPLQAVSTVELAAQRFGEEVPEQENIGAGESRAEILCLDDPKFDSLPVTEVSQLVGNLRPRGVEYCQYRHESTPSA